ncbi:hypothetical protein [Streptomyces sp. NPDC012510]|uniref:hypothetical protein n=1 Tax=Streptomyces sp. NPDC012510 TaxID=3364838 RepID=UPI0036EAEE68
MDETAWLRADPGDSAMEHGDASCPLHEAAALLTDNAGMRIMWAARALHPQGAI